MTQVAPRHRYTLSDYLDVEEVSVVRHEFIDGEIIAMAGGTPEHAALASAIPAMMGNQLRGTSCRTYSADLRIRVGATGLATYADASVVCDPVLRDPNSPTHVLNPTVIFEVLSRGTETYDRGEKRHHYQQLESLCEYVLLSQDARRIEVWSRRRDSQEWVHTEYGSGATVELGSIGCRIEVDELYDVAGIR
jgi:Uma2 family endonuclease